MISGLQKMTLLDFPGKVACTVFLHGCNYRCPFCHNSQLLGGKGEEAITQEEFLAFLKKRVGLLDGVAVSGGEPTLYKGLEQMLAQIKALGFAVKLDTNGGRPQVLKDLVEKGLVDYVAMDVKNGPDAYGQTVGIAGFDLAATEESLRFLIDGKVAYELRTTLVEPLHTRESVLQMGQWLAALVPGKKPKQLFLQRFVDRDTVIFEGLCTPDEDTVYCYQELLTPYVDKIALRGG